MFNAVFFCRPKCISDFRFASILINSDMIQPAADLIRQCANGEFILSKFRTAVILGSGLGAAGQLALDAGGVVIGYEQIPGMPQPAVAGHAGRLIIGKGEFDGVLFLQGRVHYYEGHSLDRMLFAVKLLHELGVKRLIVTNAAGGITSGFQPGDLTLINGHWTFLKVSEDAHNSGRTPAAAHLWNQSLVHIAKQVDTSLNVHQGVYAMMSGPNYETPAEVRMLHHLGVDAVGMSTVPEALAAARRGIDVLGVSCITNIASGLSDKPLDHAEVSETAANVEHEFTSWLTQVLHQLA